MAPAKRKRSERASVDGGESRPSPHRPGNTNLAQHDRGDMRDGGRRSSRGGQGGGGPGGGRGRRNERSDRNDSRDAPSKLTISARATPTPGPMSPPPRASSANQTPTSTVALPSPLPKRDPEPYDYTFLTEPRLSAWDTNGRQEVITAGVQARQDEDIIDLASCFQELIRATLDSRLDPVDAGNCVKEILGPDTAPTDGAFGTFDGHTFFLDTLSMICDAEEPPFNPLLRPFAVATGVSPIVMRQKLDAQLLQNLNLTRDTFIRVGIRQATHLLYRQANFNLLREETEGYSKLITELFTTSGAAPPSGEAVEDAFERVKGLIGTFDLDVGRVLDITLDVFAAVLIKHYRFFVKLLRVSSWWPRSGIIDGVANSGGLPAWALPGSQHWEATEAEEEAFRLQMVGRDRDFWGRAREVGLDAFFELGGRQVVDAETKARIFNSKSDSDAELDADRKWIEGTGTFPPSGNRVAAQLLGFKLRFYGSPSRDKDDVLPANLIYLTALLIKIGFISLRDLYPHLWPWDEDMPAVKESRMKELAEKERLNRPGGGATNALMMAGALADDTLPNNGRTREAPSTKSDTTPKAKEAEDEDKLSEPLDQKVQLLNCLLTIGAIPEALFILGRFPWLTEAYPELLDLINRILLHSIKDVYDACRPIAAQNFQCPTKKVADPDQSGMPKGDVRLAQIATRKQLRWPFPAKFDTNENLSYRFYWDEWADNIPLCQSVDDIFTLCSTFLNFSGVNIGKDAILLSKLARIGVKSLADDPSPHNLERWRDLLTRLLVPALSLTKSNTSVVNEIYDMLRFYPISVRYAIYTEWFEGPTSRNPAIIRAFARTKLETESIMKRISMTNLTQMARSLAKTAYASPGIVFRVALNQIESYNNLTEVVVECAKYFTDLGYDVLVWSLMSSLGGKGRNRANEEFALLPSKWLLALARFAGKVFKRYSIMNLSPIIQYVNDQLYRSNSTDLVILKELIAQMAGVVPDTDFTDAQLSAMTGGELLRRQTLINLQDKRHESVKTAKRLMKALTETKLAGQLLLSIAQHRQSAIYAVSDEEAHIKMLATMIDDTQLILFQYLDLLRSNLEVEEFDKHVPAISELMTEYGLEPPLAFMLGRGSLSNRLAKITSSTLNGAVKSPSTATAEIDTEGDMSMQEDVDNETTVVSQSNGSLDKVGEDVQMAEAKEEISSQSSITSTDPFYDIVSPILGTVKDLLPETVWRSISPEFYVTFWTSMLCDLAVPSPSYEAEIQRLLKEQEAVMKDRSDMTRAGMAKKEETKKTIIETREKLLAELGKQVGTYTQTKSRLLKRKGGWFERTAKGDAISDMFLERCLIPRLLLSPSDADFCFKMVKFLHDNGTPNFRTLSLYGRIFRAHRLRSVIFTCTVREAENLGRFIRLVLTDLSRWHSDVALYEKEAWGKSEKSNKNLPGFAKALDTDGTPKGFLEHDGGFGFKNILLSWHKNLNTALRECLEGVEWMHIRNAITILKSVAEVFPAVDFMGNNFMKQLETITTREKGTREDLSLTGNAVLVQLKKRQKKWIMVQAFGGVIPNKVNGAARTPSQASGATSKTTLKPTAPEFKPQSRASSLGASTPKPAEVEDGEVDDAKVSASSVLKATNARGTPEPRPSTPATSTIEPKKSEILLRREQIQRENAAKAAAQNSMPPRPDLSRVPNSADRGPHNLPSRPDAPFPGRHLIDRSRQPDRRDIREPRDSRPPDSGRIDRPGDRPRDYPPNDRRSGEPLPRDFGRSSDRHAGSDRERGRPEPPPRWTPDSARENLERTVNANRAIDNSGRLSRENGMPPPRSSGISSDRASATNPDRLPPINADRADIINPERAARISYQPSPAESPRRPREDTREHTSSRPQSPRRHNHDRDHDSRRDEGLNRGGPDMQSSSRSRVDDVLPPPAGPRGDRPSDRGNERNDRLAFQPTPTPPRPIDLDHGRLNASGRQQADPNFGRLNSGPSQDIPSGPRDRSSRGNRTSSGPRRDGRTDIPRPPTPEKQPPTGPSSGRHPRRSASGQFDSPLNGPSSMPTTPSIPVAAPPVHPDRLKQLPPQAIPPPRVASSSTPITPSGPPAGGVHPDRIRIIDSETPNKPPFPQNQGNNNRGRPNIPAVVTGGPPSGPKGSQSSPIMSGSNGLAPPTGPASATERAARGGRRQLAGINTMLQQAGQQNGPERMNVRGRGRVSGTGQPDTPLSNASPINLQPPPPPMGRPDFRDSGRDLVNPERADLITGGASQTDDKEKDRGGRRERSGRHSRRTSRSPDRNRDPKRMPSEEERPSRNDHRERRGGEREGERERHHGGTPGHRGDVPAGREAGSSRESGRDRDRERDSSRRDGRERHSGRVDPHETGWGVGNERPADGTPTGRSRDMRGDDRREPRQSRGGEDRKRRNDEGMMDSRGHDKRPRRN
ncbi:transcription factor/nuclear export subunit protein 2-domain-containing protein [Tricladium varicosporioides]|nr:transcription factor/nuclear export subunit protein 2-domain-containing protein [Hymenoscyphus varicosporioides]